MTDHQRVSELFIRACELPLPERVSFLEKECRGDEALLAEVQAMLAEDSRLGGTASMLELVGAVAAEAGAQGPDVPERIGPYRILERLGEGGMGIVYRAEQEEPIRRIVALKVIRSAFHSEAALARFCSERQTLALLEHPNIAKVLDAGSTGNGQPYLVMELIHGKPIGTYCRAGQIDVRTRVLLFRDVCRAVRHAHRRGIIHRDIKPSNVLVTETGGRPAPKVIDFSIAKMLEGSGDSSAPRTLTGEVIGTLEYMSPEQARGEIVRIDTRSDVYSLGVLFYELLAGRRPYEVSDLALPDAVHLITTEPPQRLRAAGMTTGRVDADLETIVGKCLEKNPDRRYGSAAELVEDLDRFIEHRPILARPPSTTYQIRKLVGRHRVAAGVTALVIMFLLILSITMTVQFGIQRRERLRAEAETRKAQQITSFLTGILEAANPYKAGGDLRVREVLDRAAREARVDLSDQPEVLAAVEGTIGKSYKGIGLHEEALPHLEESLRLHIESFGENHPDVVRALNSLAGGLAVVGRQGVEEYTERALAIGRSLWVNEDHPELANSLMLLSDVRFQQSRFEEALRLAGEAITIHRRLPEESTDLTYALMSYAVILIQMERLDEADGYLQKAAEVQLGLADERHPLYLAVLAEMAFNRDRQGKTEQAIPLYNDVLRNRIAVLGPEHPLVALSRNNLGSALIREGRCREAEPEIDEALRVWRAAYGETHRNVAAGLENRGVLLQCYGDHREAKKAYESALAIYEAGSRGLPARAARLLQRLGNASARTGDLTQAEVWARRSLELLEEKGQRDRPIARWPLHQMGTTMLEGGRPEEAEEWLRQALRLIDDAKEHPDYPIHINAFGRCLTALDRVAEAEALMEEARPALLSQRTSPVLRRYELRATAAYYDRQGKPSIAAEYLAALDRFDRDLVEETEPVPSRATPPVEATYLPGRRPR